MTCRNRARDPRGNECYEDQCEEHPNGCHAVLLAPGVEYHETPAYKRPPNPGALEAEAFERDIDETEMKLLALRINRQLASDEAFKAAQ